MTPCKDRCFGWVPCWVTVWWNCCVAPVSSHNSSSERPVLLETHATRARHMRLQTLASAGRVNIFPDIYGGSWKMDVLVTSNVFSCLGCGASALYTNLPLSSRTSTPIFPVPRWNVPVAALGTRAPGCVCSRIHISTRELWKAMYRKQLLLGWSGRDAALLLLFSPLWLETSPSVSPTPGSHPSLPAKQSFGRCLSTGTTPKTQCNAITDLWGEQMDSGNKSILGGKWPPSAPFCWHNDLL